MATAEYIRIQCQKERLVFYKRMLFDYENKLCDSNLAGMCYYVLSKGFHLSWFPELSSLKPKLSKFSTYWFPLRGATPERINLIKQAIKITENEIQNSI